VYNSWGVYERGEAERRPKKSINHVPKMPSILKIVSSRGAGGGEKGEGRF